MPEIAAPGTLIHGGTGRVLTTRAYIANDLWAQFTGLMGRAGAGENVALGLPHCRLVHTAFVRGALDVVFCDQAGKALLVVANLAPWRISPLAPKGAAWAWEAEAGTLAPFVAVGDEIRYNKAA